jgi:hypothetical protein
MEKVFYVNIIFTDKAICLSVTIYNQDINKQLNEI